MGAASASSSVIPWQSNWAALLRCLRAGERDSAAGCVRVQVRHVAWWVVGEQPRSVNQVRPRTRFVTRCGALITKESLDLLPEKLRQRKEASISSGR